MLFGRSLMPSAPDAFLGMEGVVPLSLTMTAGGILLNRALRLLTPTPAEVQLDPRSPSILLRSFEDDDTRHDRHKYGSEILVSHFSFTKWHSNTLEEAIVEPLSELGPVVTVADPRHKARPLGATRVQLSGTEWQKDVNLWIDRCRTVVMIMGETPGLMWELQQLALRESLSKLLIVVPPLPQDMLEIRWQATRNALSQAVPALAVPAALPSDAAVIGFTSSGSCDVVTALERGSDAYRRIFASKFGSIAQPRSEFSDAMHTAWLWVVAAVVFFLVVVPLVLWLM